MTPSGGLCGKPFISPKRKQSEDWRSDLTPGPEQEGAIRIAVQGSGLQVESAIVLPLASGRLGVCACACARVPSVAPTRELGIPLIVSKHHCAFQSSFHTNQDSQVAGHTETPQGQGHGRRRTVLSEGHFEIPTARPHPNPNGPRTT